MADPPSERLIYFHVDASRPKGPGIIGLERNPFTDIRVRRALFLAVHRNSLGTMIMNGNAYATNQMVLKGRRGYSEKIPAPVYDPAEAKNSSRRRAILSGRLQGLPGRSERQVRE